MKIEVIERKFPRSPIDRVVGTHYFVLKIGDDFTTTIDKAEWETLVKWFKRHPEGR